MFKLQQRLCFWLCLEFSLKCTNRTYLKTLMDFLTRCPSKIRKPWRKEFYLRISCEVKVIVLANMAVSYHEVTEIGLFLYNKETQPSWVMRCVQLLQICTRITAGSNDVSCFIINAHCASQLFTGCCPCPLVQKHMTREISLFLSFLDSVSYLHVHS